MTLQEWFNENKGKELLVPGQAQEYAGQCFQAVDCYQHDVLGLPYFYAPVAVDYWTNPGWLLNYFDKITDGSIKAGDIVVYSGGINGGAGHVDVAAEDGTTANYVGYDSNWNTLELEQVIHDGHDNSFILGSLRRKVVAPTPTPSPQPEKALTVTGSLGMNVRTAPSTSAPIYEQLPKGTVVNYVEVVTGTSVGGNNVWLKSAQGHFYWSGNTNYKA